MSTNFPVNIDDYADPNGSTSLASNNHSQLHKNHNDAIEAIEAKVWKNGDTNQSSHSYKLSTVVWSSKAESQGNKGQANGYVPLDANSKISQSYLPTVIVSSESEGVQNQVGDAVPLPAGASVVYDDGLKTITITLSDGSKTVYSETSIKSYAPTASGGVLLATVSKTGTYNVSTHAITYTDGVVVDGITGLVSNSYSTFAFKNKDNVFSQVNTFNNDVILNGRVSSPYSPITVVGSDLIVDGKLGHMQKATVTGTSAITFKAKNMVPGQYLLTINKTGGTATLTVPTSGSKATGGASSTATIGDTTDDNSLLGFYKAVSAPLPATLDNGVHKIILDVQEFYVHLTYAGKYVGY